MIVPPRCPSLRNFAGMLFLLVPALAPFSVGRAAVLDPLRINVGGPAHTDRHGNTWSADRWFVGGRVVSVGPERSIGNTDDDALYRTFRYSTSSRAPMRYRIPVKNGEYTVRLHFCETDGRLMRPGGRIFDVRMEGRVILNDLDIYRDGGGDRAVVRSGRVNVQDGALDLDFGRVAHNPLLNALEVIPVANGGQRARPARPGKPSVVTVTESAITLAWSGSPEHVAYEIRRDGRIVGTIGGGATRFTDRTVQPSQRYQYEIVALDGGGNAATSNAAWISSTRKKAGPAQVTLTWLDNARNEDGFRIERSTDGRSFKEIARVRANVTRYQDTELKDGVRYWYRVHAYNAYGPSGYSNTVNFAVPGS